MLVLDVQGFPGAVGGYAPIEYMSILAARVFGAELIVVRRDRRKPALLAEAILAQLGRRPRGSEPCLVVAPWPSDLDEVIKIQGWRSRLGPIAGWVIDSFAHECGSNATRRLHAYDHVFSSHLEDVDYLRRQARARASWLPVGSDVLGLGNDRSDRPFDVLRVGRQPEEWDDDAVTAESCRRRGLSFHGRFPNGRDVVDNQRILHDHYSRAKFCMAFCNLAAPAPYTHGHRAYLTARWVDAISSGAVVAGIRPNEPDTDRLLWPEATLELGTIKREEGMDILVDAIQDWTPERAVLNRAMALQKLDWRLRFKEVAEVLGVDPPILRNELEQIRSAAGDKVVSPPLAH